MIKLPLWMRLLNWWDVRVLGKSVVRGYIRYAPPGSAGFKPKLSVDGVLRVSEWIAKRPREPKP